MSAFERHPKLTLSVFLFVFALLIAGLLEIALRFIVPYDIGYYVAVRDKGVYTYPYGEIIMNSEGFPDTEFDLDGRKKRIGYFGDSVTFGVGAGRGYRFSDLLEEKFPSYDHWTFSMLANGIQDQAIVDMVESHGLDGVVYALNLNDLLPTVEAKDETQNIDRPPLLYRLQMWVRTVPDQYLRGTSYLYTWLRTTVKNALTRFGVSDTGFQAAELFPSQNKDVLEDVAARVNATGKALRARGIPFCVILLPYEMQVSGHAAQIYRHLGVDWEEGFEDGSTQKLIKDALEVRHIYDGLAAFEGLKDSAQAGDFFVYNKGDKIDFNHPNRAGHARLTDGFLNSRACPLYR